MTFSPVCHVGGDSTDEKKGERLMANNEYDLDDDFDEYDDNAIAQVRKAHKAANRRVKELEAELAGFRSESRKRSVQDVLTSRGYNPKIADLIPEGLTGTDEIASWLEERADVFQPTPMVGSDGQGSDGQGNGQVQAPPGMQQFNEVVQAGQAPTGDESQLLALMQAAKTPEDLNKIIFGNALGPAL